jgi:hypothetical protein
MTKRNLLRSQAWRPDRKRFYDRSSIVVIIVRGQVHLIATATLADDQDSNALVKRVGLPSASDAKEMIVGIALDRPRGCHV